MFRVLLRATVTNIDIACVYFKHVKSKGWGKVLGVRVGWHSTGGGRYGRAAQHRLPTLHTILYNPGTM